MRRNQMVNDKGRPLHSDQIDKLLRRYVKKALELEHGFSAHSMRATFITTVPDNGAPLEDEDLRRAVGHADPPTTKLYDCCGHSPENSASFLATTEMMAKLNLDGERTTTMLFALVVSLARWPGSRLDGVGRIIL